MRLKDKVVLVTGSTTGIGEAIARRCASEGARVVIHGLEHDLAERVARSLSPAAAFHCNDLSRPEAPDELVRFTLSTFGRIDAIVNNAAVLERANLDATTPEVFDRIIAVNLRAPLLLIRAAFASLKESRGAVLNIGSINAYCGLPTLLPYSISKGGLMTLTRNLADAFCYEGVRVNQINVGWVLTENENKLQITEGLPPNWSDHPPRTYAPSGRLLAPEQVAILAAYWISDESRPVSGTVMEFEQFPVIGRNNPARDG